jgi:hypothetical protein
MNIGKTFVACFAVCCNVASLTSLAETVVIGCDAPKGQRVEYGTDRAQETPVWLEDGYSGVRPLFIYDDAKPGELVFFWGNTRPDGVPIELVPATKKGVAQVLSANSEVLLAVMSGPRYIETYYFFFVPESDVAFATFGSHKPFAEGAKADLLSTLCKVSVDKR